MNKPKESRMARLINPVTLLFAALVLLVGGLPLASAVTLYTLYSQTQRHEAEAGAHRTATLLLESFEQTIGPIDSLLRNFASNYNSTWNADQTYNALKEYSLPPTIVQFAVADKTGMMVASNLAPPQGDKVDLSDREHIQVHMKKNVGQGDLFISKPILGRVSKNWTIQLTHALPDAEGNFAGVVIMSYAISDFIDFYKRLRVDEDMLVSLVGLDGVVRARAGEKTSFGDDISKSETFQKAMLKKESAYEFNSPIDGIARIAYSIRSDRYPILVVVGYSVNYVRAKTAAFRNAIWGTALGLAVALLIVGLLTVRYFGTLKRLETQEMEARARQREASVLEAISRVPGVSVMHLTEEGPSEIGVSAEGPLPAALENYLGTESFKALAGKLTEPVVRQAHLPNADRDLEVEMVVVPLRAMEAASGAAQKEVVVFAVDQTLRRMEEQKLYQISKLASLGEVATGLAHEINQPLGVIRLAASNALIGMKKGMGPAHLALKLDRIIQQTVRMTGIIDHMRIFGRKSDERVQPCKPSDAVEGAMQVVGAHFRLDNIGVDTRYESGLPEVICRQNQLEQVLINLMQNARDAIQEKRKRQPDLRGHIQVDAEVDRTGAGHFVKIKVSDNAGGIPPEVLDRIFQPFFTTKPPGKGTGLGLSVSFGIIREHGGDIKVENGPEGAIFTIRLPASDARSGTAVATTTPSAVPSVLPAA